MSLEDTQREIVSLREQLAQKGARIATFDGRVTRLRAERDAARSEASKLARRLDEANAALKDLETKIERQATTIKVQSEQIAGPRETNTPRRNAGLTPRKPTYAQPPPAYNPQPPPIYNQPPPVYGSSSQGYNQPPQIHIQPNPTIGSQHSENPTALPRSSSIFRASSSLQPQVFVSPAPRVSPLPPKGGFTPMQSNWTPNAAGSSLHASAFASSGTKRSPLPLKGGSTPLQNSWTPNPSNPLVFPAADPRQNSVSQPSRQNSFAEGAMVPYQPLRHPSAIPRPLDNSFGNAPGRPVEPMSTLTQYDLAKAASALNIRGDEFEIIWSTNVNRLFNLTELWAHNYANVPDNVRDRGLGPGVMAAFMRQVEPENMGPLLASAATRYFMVARFLNSVITSEILKGSMFKPFRPEVEEAAGKLMSAVQQKISPHITMALMYDLSTAAKEMIATPGFDEWLGNQAHWKCQSVWTQARGVLAPKVKESQALEDLMYVFTESYRLAVQMALHPLPAKIGYPQLGKKSFFNPGTMYNRDPAFKGDPKSLTLQGLRVCLAITPIIVVSDLDSGTMEPRTCYFGNVLLQR